MQSVGNAELNMTLQVIVLFNNSIDIANHKGNPRKKLLK